MSNAWIIDAVRTPRGRGKPGKGSLSGTHPQALLSQTLNRVAERTGIDKKDVEDVGVGCVSQAGEQGANIAELAPLERLAPRGDRRFAERSYSRAETSGAGGGSAKTGIL